MRPKDMKPTLGEIMGKAPQDGSMTLKDLPNIIGPDQMQELPPNAVGKYRLRRALQQRFGNGYRNMPGVRGLLKEFDDEIQFQSVLERVRKIQPKGNK